MIGFLAAFLVTIAYLPQAIQVYKTKRCDMSLWTLIILLLGMSCWIIHALYHLDLALLVSSLFSLAQLLFLLKYKI